MSPLHKKSFCLSLAIWLFFSWSLTPVLTAIDYSYDANGNMISDGAQCFVYNQANQLSQVKNCSTQQLIAEYVYDYSGTRIAKKIYENGSLKETVYSPTKEYETKKLANGSTEDTTYYSVNQEIVAKKNNNTVTYFHNDHLGSNSLTTDQSGTEIENTSYYPFGKLITGGINTKYQFTGKEKDLETNLNYYGARYYNSHLAHFSQPDTQLPDPYDPQQLNRYAYARNNPLKYTDPSGHFLFIPAGIYLGITTYSMALASFQDFYTDSQYLASAVTEYQQNPSAGTALGVGLSAISFISPAISLSGISKNVANLANDSKGAQTQVGGAVETIVNKSTNTGKVPIPHTPGVYLGSDFGQTLTSYVGKATDIADRAYKHSKLPNPREVYPFFTHDNGIPLTGWQRSAIEQYLIELAGGPTGRNFSNTSTQLTNIINSVSKNNNKSEYMKKMQYAADYLTRF